jgi:hypothetical protein
MVSKCGVLAHGDLLGSRGRTVLNLSAITFVNGRLTDQTFADDKTKSPASGPTPVRNLGRPCSITPTNAIRRKRIEAVSLASTGPTSSKIAEDRRQARRLSSQLDRYVTASMRGGRAAIGFEFAYKRNLTTHPTTTLWATGQLPAAA